MKVIYSLDDRGGPELPAGSAMVSEPPGPGVATTTSGTGVLMSSMVSNGSFE